jgi:hypothetical protein
LRCHRVYGHADASQKQWICGSSDMLLGRIDLENGAKAISGLKAYEVSPWFRTATIRYDPNVLSFDLWNDFCSIKHDPSVEKSIRDRLLSVFETHPAQ